MSKTRKFVLVPDGQCTGLWCTGSWTAINNAGKIGGSSDGYPMSPDQKKKLIKSTRAALKVAQNSVAELAIALERLRTAPTKNW